MVFANSATSWRCPYPEDEIINVWLDCHVACLVPLLRGPFHGRGIQRHPSVVEKGKVDLDIGVGCCQETHRHSRAACPLSQLNEIRVGDARRVVI